MSEPVMPPRPGDRGVVHDLVAGVVPVDEREAADRADILAWIASGAGLYRRTPPADPPKHLVTYFLPYHAGTDAVFLVEHRKAGLLLPPGGHVESDEPPWDTVVREAQEELGVVARPHPLTPDRRPLFVTVTPTVGPHSHLDATLWWLLDLDPAQRIAADPGEFSGWGWHPRREVAGWPAGRTDPELGRFLSKVEHLTTRTGQGAVTR
ncbi:NUDIX domain-containing protein [Dactylosporangium vinaceum]|uniref:NUDIX domain-containing protein n=1 Tax=Dactylosporangium vinaceum TaxID=53362 RepID=A0ABV5M2R1_9ACTN|nr:NUDIX domain-containing protein [Dactylosporangium vinaceum]UAB96355.1 NUDIX domain-containing protein [Dactylosporangium vinaceum]